ncbi:MAG: hypothetical protein QM756_07825 [Polyangiaceae bacterium]
MALLSGATACQQPPARSVTAEYLAGMEDAIQRMQPRQLPTIIVTWSKDALELGQCRRIAGEAIIYLHLGVIADRAQSADQVRALTAEVLAHELGHAELSCTDADHAALLPHAHRLSKAERPRRPDNEGPDVKRSYVWETEFRNLP